MKVTWPQKRSTLTTCAAPAADESLLHLREGPPLDVTSLVERTSVGRPMIGRKLKPIERFNPAAQ
ncbi:MAG: hypothetical protein ACTS43_01690 [Candidatus Hodgkinia cicadicola]